MKYVHESDATVTIIDPELKHAIKVIVEVVLLIRIQYELGLAPVNEIAALTLEDTALLHSRKVSRIVWPQKTLRLWKSRVLRYAPHLRMASSKDIQLTFGIITQDG